MDPHQVLRNLEAIASTDDFSYESSDLVDRWIDEGVGLPALGPILRFMEDHPEIDYGLPGPLVHFAERFYKAGYEELLLTSVARKPTPMTTWMLNRLINGTSDAATRRKYVHALERASLHPNLDEDTRAQVQDFRNRSRGFSAPRAIRRVGAMAAPTR